MTTILVVGASGLLGREVYRILSEDKRFHVVGTYNNRKVENLIPFQFSNASQVETLFNEIQPSIIINCIAIRQPDIVEKDPITTELLNVVLPRTLAEECNKRNCFFIHFSTDYVFDGTKWPYHPSDPCCPINKYGESKLQSEKVVSNACKNSLIVRIPILYGPGEFKESAVLCLFSKLQDSTECKIDHIAKRVPTLTTDIAITIHNFIINQCSLRGIVHISSNKEYTKYEMVQYMASLVHKPIDHIIPLMEDTNTVKRPYNCHLDCTELRNAGVLYVRDFDEGVIEVFQKAGIC